jgi:uncharacterized protein
MSRPRRPSELVEAVSVCYLPIMRLALILVSLFLASPASAAGPSFDCAKAKAPDEIAICGDEQLSQLDRLMAAAYDEARRPGFLFEQGLC